LAKQKLKDGERRQFILDRDVDTMLGDLVTLTGRTMTQIVEDAIRDEFARVEPDAKIDVVNESLARLDRQAADLARERADLQERLAELSGVKKRRDLHERRWSVEVEEGIRRAVDVVSAKIATGEPWVEIQRVAVVQSRRVLRGRVSAEDLIERAYAFSSSGR
jgi:hypothetical protein